MTLRLCLMAFAISTLLCAQDRETAITQAMKIHIIRLHPGDDLLKSLSNYAQKHHLRAAIILTTVGRLTQTRLRFANRPEAATVNGKVEIVSLVGTIDASAAHLHLSVSDGKGHTTGGHLMEGNKIYTTAEIAIGGLPGLQFSREPDPASGYGELKIDTVTSSK